MYASGEKAAGAIYDFSPLCYVDRVLSSLYLHVLTHLFLEGCLEISMLGSARGRRSSFDGSRSYFVLLVEMHLIGAYFDHVFYV